MRYGVPLRLVVCLLSECAILESGSSRRSRRGTRSGKRGNAAGKIAKMRQQGCTSCIVKTSLQTWNQQTQTASIFVHIQSDYVGESRDYRVEFSTVSRWLWSLPVYRFGYLRFSSCFSSIALITETVKVLIIAKIYEYLFLSGDI